MKLISFLVDLWVEAVDLFIDFISYIILPILAVFLMFILLLIIIGF